MPPKKAEKTASPAAESKPAPAAAPSKKAAAVEKPAAEKPAAKVEATTTTTTTTTSSSAATGGHAPKPISADPAEAAIQKRLNEIEEEIRQNRNALDKIKDGLNSAQPGKEGLKSQRETLFNRRKELRDANSEKSKKIGELIKQAQEKDRLLKIKEAELKAMREANQLYGKDKTPEVYLAEIDARIKEVEKKQTSGAAGSLKEEKSIMTEIGVLKKQRANYKTYWDQDQAYKKERSELKEFRDSINVQRAEAQKGYDEMDEIKKGIEELDSQFNTSKETSNTFITERSTTRDKLNALKEELDAKKKELSEYRDKKAKERKETYEAEKEARRRVEREIQDRKREAEQKRFEEELKQEPFSEEVEVIDKLIKYLNSLPKAPKPAAAAAAGSPTATPAAAAAKPAAEVKAEAKTDAKPASPAPLRENGPTGVPLVRDKDDDSVPLSKRNKKKPVKEQKDTEFKHHLQTVVQFEQVSLVPPAKASDVEKSLAQLREKRSYFQKKAVDETKAKVEALKASRAKNTTEQQQASEPTPNPAEPTESSTTSTTSTSTSSSSNEAVTV